MDEIWKDIVGHEGEYQISNLGNVKSLERKVYTRRGFWLRVSEKILKPAIGNSGYYYISIGRIPNYKSRDIHRLVALHFIGHENSFLTVNHKDGNKLNNHLDNLEFMTQAENNIHSRNVLGQKRYYDNSGSKNPMFGRKHSEATLEKIRRTKKPKTIYEK